MYGYGEIVWQHFIDPKNVGEMEDPDVVGSIRHALYGEKVTIYLKIREGVIIDAKYKAKTSVLGIAAGSFITEYAKGMNIEEAFTITTSDIISELRAWHRGCRSEYYSADMAITAFHNALTKYKEKIECKL